MGDTSREVSYTISGKDQITDVLERVLTLLKQLDAAGNKQAPLSGLDKAAVGAQKTADNLNKAATNAKTAAGEVDKLGNAAGKAADKTKGIPDGLKDFTLLAGKAVVVLKGIELAVGVIENAWGLVRASISGTTDEVAQFRTSLAETVKVVPILGDATLALGGKLNEFWNAVGNFASGEGFETDETKAVRVLKETAALEKHTAKLKADADAQKLLAESIKGVQDSLRDELASLTFTEQDQALRKVAESVKQIDKVLSEKQQPFFDRFGNINEMGKALQLFREQYVARAEQAYKTEFIEKVAADESELQAERLRLADQTGAAEKVILEKQLRDEELAKAKSSARQAQIDERTIATKRARFDKEQKEEQDRVLSEFGADITQRKLRAAGTLAATQDADRVALNLKQQFELLDEIKKLKGVGASADDVQTATDLITNVQALERQALDRQQLTEQAKHDVDQLGTHQGDLNFEIERAARLYQDGAVSLHDATAKQQRDIQAFSEELNRVAADLEGKLAHGIISDEDAEELRRRLAQVREDLTKTRTETQKLAEGLENDTANAISTFAQSAITNFGNIRSAFGSMLESFGNSIIKLQTDAFAKSITSQLAGGQPGGGLFGFLTGGATSGGEQAGGLFGSLFKGIGSLFGFAAGGPVPGVGSGDTVPAMLTPNEYIIPAPIVRNLGVDFFDRLIGRHILRSAASPRLISEPLQFAGGGVVPAVKPEIHVLPVLVADDQSVERFLKGGNTALMRHLANHGVKMGPRGTSRS